MNNKTFVIMPVLGIGVCVVAYGLTKGLLNDPAAHIRIAARPDSGAMSSPLALIGDNVRKKPLSEYLSGRESGLFEPPGASAQSEEDPFDLDALLDAGEEESPT